MKKLTANELIDLREKLPRNYARLVARRHKEKFLNEDDDEITSNSVYRGLTVSNYSDNIVNCALEILGEQSEKAQKGLDILRPTSHAS